MHEGSSAWMRRAKAIGTNAERNAVLRDAAPWRRSLKHLFAHNGPTGVSRPQLAGRMPKRDADRQPRGRNNSLGFYYDDKTQRGFREAGWSRLEPVPSGGGEWSGLGARWVWVWVGIRRWA